MSEIKYIGQMSSSQNSRVIDPEGISYAVTNGEKDGEPKIIEPIGCGHIHEGTFRALGLGRTGGAPQEGDDLAALALAVGVEAVGGGTGGDAILHCPQNCLVVVSIRCHICEGHCRSLRICSGQSRCLAYVRSVCTCAGLLPRRFPVL